MINKRIDTGRLKINMQNIKPLIQMQRDHVCLGSYGIRLTISIVLMFSDLILYQQRRFRTNSPTEGLVCGIFCICPD